MESEGQNIGLEEYLPSDNPENETKRRAHSFTTEQGSVYIYDEQGRTSRYKKVTREQQAAQDLTVFLPLDFEETEMFLEAYRADSPRHTPGEKVYVIERLPDDRSRVVRRRDEIEDPDRLYLGIFNGQTVVKIKKVTLEPTVGYSVFDTRHFQKDGEFHTERHLGNRVVSIEYDPDDGQV